MRNINKYYFELFILYLGSDLLIWKFKIQRIVLGSRKILEKKILARYLITFFRTIIDFITYKLSKITIWFTASIRKPKKKGFLLWYFVNFSQVLKKANLCRRWEKITIINLIDSSSFVMIDWLVQDKNFVKLINLKGQIWLFMIFWLYTHILNFREYFIF